MHLGNFFNSYYSIIWVCEFICPENVQLLSSWALLADGMEKWSCKGKSVCCSDIRTATRSCPKKLIVTFIMKRRKLRCTTEAVPLSFYWDMVETPLWIDMQEDTSIARVGEQLIPLQTTGGASLLSLLIWPTVEEIETFHGIQGCSSHPPADSFLWCSGETKLERVDARELDHRVTWCCVGTFELHSAFVAYRYVCTVTNKKKAKKNW